MSDAPWNQWLIEPLPPDVKNALRRLAACPDVRRIAVMPDVHLAHDVCVGTVLATSTAIYPSAVGGDIGCGMAALAFDATADLLAGESTAVKLFAALYDGVPPNRHRAARDLPADLVVRPLSDPALESVKRRDARVQLGTLGRGNHFLEFQSDDADGGRLWLMLHTGSRAIGQSIRDHHADVAARQLTPGSEPQAMTRIPSRALPHLDATTPAGIAYLADMAWALEYARANRDAILAAVADAMGALFNVEPIPSTHVDCHHNFVRREIHFGEQLWVHRKGARPAAAGEPGLIPGSMGSTSYHTLGRGCPESLNSSSHGAGRAMSRDQARRAISANELRRQLRAVHFDPRLAVRLRDGAPSAYKDVAAVMRAQRPLTRIVRTLRPVLSYKGP